MKRLSPPLIPKSTESGFTIIESLLAIIVVGLLIVGIGPIIAFSAATRIQARRAEWAAQAAQEYLNGVRAGTIDAPTIHTLNQHDGVKYIEHLRNLATPNGGTLNCQSRTNNNSNNPKDGYCTAPTVSNSDLYCFDGDDDGRCTTNGIQDFIIQAGGVQYQDGNPADPDEGYLLGIRVYRADGFQDPGAFKATDENEKRTDLTHAGGLGDRKAPLFETITEVTGTDAQYNDLCKRLNQSGSCN